jgi:hypothetical protein
MGGRMGGRCRGGSRALMGRKRRTRCFLPLGGSTRTSQNHRSLQSAGTIDISPYAATRDVILTKCVKCPYYAFDKVSALFCMSVSTRQQSVYNALKSLPEECAGVLIHDGARPFYTSGRTSCACVHATLETRRVRAWARSSD